MLNLTHSLTHSLTAVCLSLFETHSYGQLLFPVIAVLAWLNIVGFTLVFYLLSDPTQPCVLCQISYKVLTIATLLSLLIFLRSYFLLTVFYCSSIALILHTGFVYVHVN